jgi:hypothetical protein
MAKRYDSVYDQVAHPSAGATTPASKVSGDIKNDALGNPSRFKRNATTVAECAPDSKVEDACKEQLGTNIELNWKRYGHDQMQQKGPQSFKKNFNNPTDNPSDLKVNN